MEPFSTSSSGASLAGWRTWLRLGFAVLVLIPFSLHAQTAGGVDSVFNPNVGPNFVHGTAVQPDGKIIITGDFANVSSLTRTKIARLLADGTPETNTTFNPGTGADFIVNCAAVQADGKILLGGDFNTVNSAARNKFARLNADGTVESTTTFTLGAGADSQVYSTAVQPDGKLLLSGFFGSVGGATRWRVARINTNGTVDTTFTTPGTGADNVVYSVVLQADGKILIGGTFTSINGSTRNRLARLAADGTVEATNTFNPLPNSHVYCIAVQPDGKILIGGEFTTNSGVARSRIARLNADGSTDTTFTPGTGADGGVYEIGLQADGKVVIGGFFSAVNGSLRSGIARLGTNGVLEGTGTFNASPNATLRSLALQADGRILLGGPFTLVNGVGRNRFARLTNDPGAQVLTIPSASLAQWTRTGAVAEVAYTTFEVSTNGGTNYTLLGTGARITGGWTFTNMNLAGNGQIRARGRTWGGFYNGSAGLVESVTAFSFFPEIAVQQPAGTNLVDGATTNDFGNGAVGVSGAPRTFIITNSGNANLTLGAFTIGGANAADFSVSAPGSTNVAPNSNTTFTVTFTPGAPGQRTASLSLTNNDTDENPFDIALTGFGMSTNAAITNLVLSSAPLTPEFSATNFSYTAYVANSSSSVTVTPTDDDPTATITVNAAPVVSGSPSAPISLNVGPNLITVIVTAQDGVRSNSYSLNVTRADPPGAPGPGFVDTNFVVNANGLFVRVAIEQPDGKLILAGDITSINGQPRLYIGRLNADGSVESTNTFNLGTGPNGGIVGAALQPDGKILLAGYFTSINGQPRNHIARLNPNGTVESTNTFNPGTGANDAIYSAMLQPDGKILLWGLFTTFDGQPRGRFARLNANGSLESTNTFNPGTGANNDIHGGALQPDGKILIGGLFTSVNGQPRQHIARLNSDGTLESTNTFNPGAGVSPGRCFSLVPQPDGKILIAGEFTGVDGQVRNRLARLNADGTLQSTNIFQNGTGFSGGEVRSVVLQTDGKILVCGYFASVNGQSRNRIVRLYANGAVESVSTFDLGAGADDGVYSALGVTVQANGGVILTGDFTSFNGQPHKHVVRLQNQPATSSLTNTSNARVEWLRGGTSPEVERVTFDMSTDGGATWSSLGNGTRIAGGWELTGLSLPGSQLIRARGHVCCSDINASFGIAEAISIAPSSGSVSNGNLSIGNTNGGSVALTVGNVSVGGTNFIELHDAQNPLVAGAGAIQVDANTIRVPADSVTNQLQITGGAGDDHFVLDATVGCTVPPGGLNIDGGGQSLSGGDTLTVKGAYTSVQYNANNIGAGNLVSDCGAVNFSGLEPVNYTSASLLNLAVNVDPSNQFSGTITTTLSAMSGATNAGNTEVGFSGGLELMDFSTLAGTLTITGDGAEVDTFVVRSVGTNFAGDIVLNAQPGDLIMMTNAIVSLASGKNFIVNGGAVTLGETTIAGNSVPIFYGGSIGIYVGGPTPGLATNQFSRLIVKGTLVLSNSPALNLSGSYTPQAGETFMLVTNDGADAIIGTFAGLPEGAQFNFNGTPMRITYAGGNGNDVALIANSAPTIAANNATVGVNEGSSVTNTGTFADVDGNATVTLSASAGSVTKNNVGTWAWSFNSTDGPDQSQTVTISASDGFATNITTFSVTVSNVAPTALAQSITTPEDTVTNIILTATDPGADTITNWTVTVGPTNGTLGGTAPNLTYTPNTNFNGGDSFKFTATDSDGATSGEAIVNLAVTSVNDAPVLGSLANFTVNPGAVISFTATATDVDTGDVLSFSLVNSPPNASITSGGAFSWRPHIAQADGTNTVKIAVTDNGSPNLAGTNSFTAIVNPSVPVLLTAPGYTNGNFQFEINGTTGPDYVIVTSTNLLDWTDRATNYAPVPPFQFTDTGAGSNGLQFYRARLQP